MIAKGEPYFALIYLSNHMHVKKNLICFFFSLVKQMYDDNVEGDNKEVQSIVLFSTGLYRYIY